MRRFRFIDESGSNLSLTRRYGRAPAGERVTESVPRNYGQQTSLISTVGLAGAAATMTVEGAVDTTVFNIYVEQVLRPTVEAGDILVLDNLSAHRASCIERVAAQCGAMVIWLPPYSPDFSPIELTWSKIKTYLRAAKARTREELEQALIAALKLVTPEDCEGWFTHCGYWGTSNCKPLYTSSPTPYDSKNIALLMIGVGSSFLSACWFVPGIEAACGTRSGKYWKILAACA